MNKKGQLFQECIDATPADIRKRVDWSFQIADFIVETLKAKGMSQKDFAKKGALNRRSLPMGERHPQLYTCYVSENLHHIRSGYY